MCPGIATCPSPFSDCFIKSYEWLVSMPQGLSVLGEEHLGPGSSALHCNLKLVQPELPALGVRGNLPCCTAGCWRLVLGCSLPN